MGRVGKDRLAKSWAPALPLVRLAKAASKLRRVSMVPLFPQQRRLKGAADRFLALASLGGIADHDDLLARLRERHEIMTGGRAGAIVEPVAHVGPGHHL